jgi:hypothetical protein
MDFESRDWWNTKGKHRRSENSDNAIFPIKHKHISFLFCVTVTALPAIPDNPVKPPDPILKH